MQVFAMITMLTLSGGSSKKANSPGNDHRPQEPTDNSDKCDAPTIDPTDFYKEYYGHPIKDLEQVKEYFESTGKKRTIWLAGDSSLDNKHWLLDIRSVPGVNGYEHIFPRVVQDVAYWMNHELVQRKVDDATCINTSIEATTVRQRQHKLLPQDRFIHDHIEDGDYLVVSVGGNDIALNPSKATMAFMTKLVFASLDSSIENGTAWGLGHFKDVFKDQIEAYILKMIGDKKPKKIGVCMVYHPDMVGRGGWADNALGRLKYNTKPERLQNLMKKLFEIATSEIRILGVEVVPIPLFEVMDGTDTKDYVERVEPSVQGGQKMAKFIFDKMDI